MESSQYHHHILHIKKTVSGEGKNISRAGGRAGCTLGICQCSPSLRTSLVPMLDRKLPEGRNFFSLSSASPKNRARHVVGSSCMFVEWLMEPLITTSSPGAGEREHRPVRVLRTLVDLALRHLLEDVSSSNSRSAQASVSTPRLCQWCSFPQNLRVPVCILSLAFRTHLR